MAKKSLPIIIFYLSLASERASRPHRVQPERGDRPASQHRVRHVLPGGRGNLHGAGQEQEGGQEDVRHDRAQGESR